MRLNSTNTGAVITSETEYLKVATARDIIERLVMLDVIDRDVLITIDAMLDEWVNQDVECDDDHSENELVEDVEPERQDAYWGYAKD